MSEKITIQLDGKYIKDLEVLKQIIPNASWEEITDNGEMVWVLIDSFMDFIREQADGHMHWEWECCGGHWHHNWGDECCWRHSDDCDGE